MDAPPKIKKKRKRRTRRKAAHQDALLRQAIVFIRTQTNKGRTIADIAEHSINPYTRKHVSGSTLANWVEGCTGGGMTRTLDAVGRACGKRLKWEDR